MSPGTSSSFVSPLWNSQSGSSQPPLLFSRLLFPSRLLDVGTSRVPSSVPSPASLTSIIPATLVIFFFEYVESFPAPGPLYPLLFDPAMLFLGYINGFCLQPCWKYWSLITWWLLTSFFPHILSTFCHFPYYVFICICVLFPVFLQKWLSIVKTGIFFPI